MSNKKYLILQVVGYIALVTAIVLMLILFFNVSARMTAIEQKQAILENRLDVIRSDGLNISH